MPTLSVVGLGKLGICTAACFAAKGFTVIGHDINEVIVEAVNKGVAPVPEPGLTELLAVAGERLKATLSYQEVINGSDITFLITPTPSLPSGHFSDAHLLAALEQLGVAYGRSGKPYHTFVITSTVSPGTIEGSLIPLLEKASGMKYPGGFGVAYNPEFIAIGSVINDFLRPDLVLIGEGEQSTGDVIASLYTRVCENTPHIARMSLVSAEIAKISLNAYITMKISFANTLSRICEEIPSADVDDITNAIGADKRVSPYYLKGGGPYGGPCFPRDNRAFQAFALKHGVHARLAEATHHANEDHSRFILDKIASRVQGKIAILGLSFKKGTPVIEESFGIHIVQQLMRLRSDTIVSVYDPLAQREARRVLGDTIHYAVSALECIKDSALCVITTDHPEFCDAALFSGISRPFILIDCWGIIDRSHLQSNIQFHAVGRTQK